MEERTFIFELIDAYRALPALWNVKTREYSDRDEKTLQYEKLLEKYKEKYPEATKKDLTQKINSLRTAHRRQVKRLDALERSGVGVTENNLSTWCYFDAMKFLRDIDQPCSPKSSLENDTEEVEDEPPRKKAKKHLSATDELILLASQRLKEKRSEFKAASEVWALKLDKMDPEQAIIAEKMINDVIYAAQLGELNVRSTPTLISPTFGNNSRSNARNVVNMSTPTSSPTKPISVQQSLFSPETVKEEYIVADDPSHAELQAIDVNRDLDNKHSPF